MDTELYKKIAENKPNISPSSVKTYFSTLKNLYQGIWKGDINLENFKKTQDIIDYISTFTASKRKTNIAALLSLNPPDEDLYKKIMMADIKVYEKDMSTQKKSETQSKNWVENDEITKLWTELKRQSDFIYKKASLDYNDIQIIQQFVILSVQGGIYIPPRRALDWAEFKLKNIDPKVDNYLDKNTFVFNKYKTAKTYGQQKIECPKPLKAIIKKWAKINKNDYLFFDINDTKLNSVKINQRFEKMFGRKVGVNLIRHSYLTTPEFIEHTKVSKKLKQIMTDMGSSIDMLPVYAKVD